MHVPEAIHTIVRNTGWTQDALAFELRVDQATISRWLSGQSIPPPEKERQLLYLAKLTSERSLFLGAAQLASVPKWYYLCARAPSYPERRVSQAQTLMKTLQEAVRSVAKRHLEIEPFSPYGFICAAVALAVPFFDDSEAFIFCDDPRKPQRFVILVNAAHNPHRRAEEVVAEFNAHIRPYIMGSDGGIMANDKLI